MNSIGAKVRHVVAAQLGVNAAELTAQTSFVDDLGADRHDMALLRLALENAFQVEIGDAATLHSVGHAEELFATRRGPGA